VAGHFGLDPCLRGLAELGTQQAEQRRLGDDAERVEFVAPTGPLENSGQFTGEALCFAGVGIGRCFGVTLAVVVRAEDAAGSVGLELRCKHASFGMQEILDFPERCARLVAHTKPRRTAIGSHNPESGHGLILHQEGRSRISSPARRLLSADCLTGAVDPGMLSA